MKFWFLELPDDDPYQHAGDRERALKAEPIELPPLGFFPSPGETLSLEIDGVQTVFLITNTDYNINTAGAATCTLMGKRLPEKTGIEYARRP